MDPKKKNIILVTLAVVAMSYAGYSFLFSGESSKAQTQTGTFKKKTREPVVGLTKKSIKKKAAAQTATKKTGLVKREGQARQKNTLKKRPGKRGSRKTKKKEVAPAA